MELRYGDGTYETISEGDFDEYFENNGYAVARTRRSHTFPGAGIYKLSIREFNRSANILNMTNSVNTPFFVETEFTIDPYIGCNNTPQLENISISQLAGETCKLDFSFQDSDEDSLSFQLVTPKQRKDVVVIDYWLPSDHEPALGREISKISIDPFSGSILFNSKNTTGMLTIALRVDEWRKIDNEYLKISSSILDHSFWLLKEDNNTPHFANLQDTAILAGHNLTLSITASDPENDSLLFNCYGDFFQLPENEHSEQFDYTLGPIQKNIDFTPTIEQVRNKPYKAIFSATNKFFNKTESSYIWVADKAHSPEPVTLFTGEEISEGVILLSWVDTEDELGYIIERADKYFPKFNRLVVLPPDISTFTDPSVVNGNTYWYRIKAVGTKMSDYLTTMMSTSDIITSLPASTINSRLKIFPNPSNGTFQVLIGTSLDCIEICDISGKTVWQKDLSIHSKTPKSIKISSGLSSGIYIINAYSNNDITSQKILIR